MRVPIVLALLGLAGASVPQQGSFKSGASTVAVYTTVTDAAGQLVPDLGRDDFEVYDNGKLQPISIFTNDVQPITVVMMLDRSASMLANFALVERGGGELRRSPPAGRQGAHRQLLGSHPGGSARVHERQGRAARHPQDRVAAGRTDPLWNAVGVGMTALLRQEGRRVVLVFTDGVDRPMNGGNNVSLGDAIKRAEHEDVMVYGIGLASAFGRGGRAPGRRWAGPAAASEGDAAREQARSRPPEARARQRRRLLRADVDAGPGVDVRPRRRRAASPVPASGSCRRNSTARRTTSRSA